MLEGVKKEVLDRVVEYMQHVTEHPYKSSNLGDEENSWYLNYISKADQGECFELISAAKQLQIKSLESLAGARVN